MAEYEKKIREILRNNNWDFKRHGKGDHDIWYNLSTGERVTVDGKIKSRHIANAILKKCGINFKF